MKSEREPGDRTGDEIANRRDARLSRSIPRRSSTTTSGRSRRRCRTSPTSTWSGENGGCAEEDWDAFAAYIKDARVQGSLDCPERAHMDNVYLELGDGSSG